MSEGILETVRAQLTNNGKMAANGMRRTGGLLNELSRVVYSACDLCKKDPTRPPLWEIEAASAVQDTEHKTIEYRDAMLRWTAFPLPGRRSSRIPIPRCRGSRALLPPIIGNSSQLGAFYGQPYYWVIDGQSDATFTPLITTKTGAVIDTQYRRRFNDGTLFVNLVGRLRDGLGARQSRHPRSVRDRRYLAVGLRHQSRVVQPVRAQSAHPAWPGGRLPTCCRATFIWRGLARAPIRGSTSKPIRA